MHATMKAALACCLAAALALLAPAQAAPPPAACSTGDHLLAFVGVGAAGSGAAPSSDCVWASSNTYSQWFVDCMQQWKVSVNRCRVTMQPASPFLASSGCPCFWFDVALSGAVNATGLATVSLHRPL
jgi:hypothetical protein